MNRYKSYLRCHPSSPGHSTSVSYSANTPRSSTSMSDYSTSPNFPQKNIHSNYNNRNYQHNSDKCQFSKHQGKPFDNSINNHNKSVNNTKSGFNALQNNEAKNEAEINKNKSINYCKGQILKDDAINPKTSLEVLEILLPGSTERLMCTSTNNGIVVNIEVKGRFYHGCGSTYNVAKEQAAEAVLKDLLFDMVVSNFSDNPYQSNRSLCEFQYDSSTWKTLASLAMHKLINEWMQYYKNNPISCVQKDESTPTSGTAAMNSVYDSAETKVYPVMSSKESVLSNESSSASVLPEIKSIKCSVDNKFSKTSDFPVTRRNKPISSTDPVVILNSLVNNLCFVDLNPDSKQPPFTCSININNEEIISDPSNSKKEARQNVAQKILKNIFGYKF